MDSRRLQTASRRLYVEYYYALLLDNATERCVKNFPPLGDLVAKSVRDDYHRRVYLRNPGAAWRPPKALTALGPR
ncbi:hypothetical protein EVAR_21872_1 [Eumeta japonica]|uniref:Uncharacterized protein n=1 Tax=Eumeta variegata TaxID=151549 RepID=A0A4C1V8I0_EUMVA|nr:hypothetical protein EVAR_21872_1 [Eumeta japonica]